MTTVEDIRDLSVREFVVGGRTYRRTDVGASPSQWQSLPFCLRVLAENAARCAGRAGGSPDAVDAVLARRTGAAVPLFPARLLLQDLLGVPLLADLAALRDAVAAAGGDPASVDAQLPVDLVVDHSLRVDTWAHQAARATNLRREHERNRERFAFLRWCEQAFTSLRIVPPGKVILHQINVERLSRVVWTDGTGEPPLVHPDTVLGTDSHTPMVNGIGVLGWGVGGLEAEAVMLGRPVVFGLPRVVGVQLRGHLAAGVTPTDLVLRVTELLRDVGVVGSFVEFFGPALATLSTADRATIANMAPEQGATANFFPVDARTVEFLRASGRRPEQVALVEGWSRAAGLWSGPETPAPEYDATVTLDLSSVHPSLAGPRRPEDRLDLGEAAAAFGRHLSAETGRSTPAGAPVTDGAATYELADGAVVIAAIASCTNTSHPRGMVTAGLLARRAVERGLRPAPWVKTSLTPGSQVIAAMLATSGLQDDQDALGFHVAGLGCATCNGGSGPLDPQVSRAVSEGDLVAVAVVSSNRNFAGRISPDVRASYLASPALVVAYALAGSLQVDLTASPLGTASDGAPVHLADLWPTEDEIDAVVASSLDPEMFDAGYDDLFDGGPLWDALPRAGTARFPWDPGSTYVRRPPYFDGLTPTPAPWQDVLGARPLVVLGDAVNTDDISPSGAIAPGSAAARLLVERGVPEVDWNSYGTRRGNHEVAVRSLFANRRLRNLMAPGTEGSVSRLHPEDVELPVFDVAVEQQRRGVPLVVVAGRDYGAGSSRDWAAKAPALLGVRAVVAVSFERIHRSNLVGTGVLPLQWPEGTDARSLGLDGSEVLDLRLPAEGLRPRATVHCTIRRTDGSAVEVPLTCCADTPDEVELLRQGGVLPAVWRERGAAR